VKIVIQVPKFESWLLADARNLARALGKPEPAITFSNVDLEVPNPEQWIAQRIGNDVRIKSPRVARSVVAQLDTAAIRAASPSFDKFHREVADSYNTWCAACGFA
jgi:hypothetical protein